MELILGITFPLLLIAASGYIIWKSTNSFEIAADFLGRKMSLGAKGASINAIASSMPEFLTTIFFLFYIKDGSEFVDNFSGGLGVVAGSAVFNILIIPIAVILFGVSRVTTNNFTLNKKVLQRDGIFLVLSNIVFIIIICQYTISYWHGIVLIAIYILYLTFLRKGFGIGEKINDEEPVIFEKQKLWPILKRLDIKQFILNGKLLNRRNAWITIIISTLIMSVGTWFLVIGTELLGKEEYHFLGKTLKGLNLPLIFLSVLLASAATSIPDTMISIRDARKGNFDDSISNAIGSNIFDLSFALGLPVLLYTIINGDITMSIHIRELSVSYWLFMWIITLIVIPVLIYSKRISKRTGIVLLILYLIFVVFILEETLNLDLFKDKVLKLIEFVNFK